MCQRKKFFKSSYKTASQLKIGKMGEEVTVHWLKNQGWEILARNWRCPHGEIDIIARQGDIVAFVEVKTRTVGYLSSPLEAINIIKQHKILKTAWLWLEEVKIQEQPRFDVAAIVINTKGQVLSFEYIESAFDGSDAQ